MDNQTKYDIIGEFYTGFENENIKLISDVIRLFFEFKEENEDLSNAKWGDLYKKIKVLIGETILPKGTRSQYCLDIGREFRMIHTTQYATMHEMYDAIKENRENLGKTINGKHTKNNIRILAEIRFLLIIISLNRMKRSVLNSDYDDIKNIKGQILRQLLLNFNPKHIIIHKFRRNGQARILIGLGMGLGVHFNINRGNIFCIAKKIENSDAKVYIRFCQFLEKHNLYHLIQYK